VSVDPNTDLLAQLADHKGAARVLEACLEQAEAQLIEAREQTDTLARALDSFFYDLRYTAPECVGERLDQLGARITPTMQALGYPKKGQPISGGPST
jgi:hypothetical protein